MLVLIWLIVPTTFLLLWDTLRTSCSDDAALFIVRRSYISGLWGHSYTAMRGNGSMLMQFDRVGHWEVDASATPTGAAMGMAPKTTMRRTNLLDPVHATWDVGIAGQLVGSIQRDVGLYSPYTSVLGLSVVRSSTGLLWGRSFLWGLDVDERSASDVAAAERFLYSGLPLAPTAYRICVANSATPEVLFSLLAMVAVADLQNDD